jgi:hypothetical protein
MIGNCTMKKGGYWLKWHVFPEAQVMRRHASQDIPAPSIPLHRSGTEIQTGGFLTALSSKRLKIEVLRDK